MRKFVEPVDEDAYDGPDLEPAPDSCPEAEPAGWAWAHSTPTLRVEHELPREVEQVLDRLDGAEPLDHPTFGAAHDLVQWTGPNAHKHARARAAYLQAHFARLRSLRRAAGNTSAR